LNLEILNYSITIGYLYFKTDLIFNIQYKLIINSFYQGFIQASLYAKIALKPHLELIDMGDVKEKIDKQNAKFMKYVKNHDAKGLASLYTENACFMGANAPMVQGNFEAFFTEFFKTGIKEIKLMTEELHDLGDYVAERSRYELTVQPPGMSTMVDKGKYVVVWKKTSSGYKIYWDIMNSDLPPPPT